MKVKKRPLLHAPIPSPYASQQKQKVVYLGSNTPFMAAFKKVKQLLYHVEKRELQSALTGKGLQDKSGRRLQQILASRIDSEPVLVKATGKAIEKALNLALFLQKQNVYHVMVTTGTVNAVDDLVAPVKPIAETMEEDMHSTEAADDRMDTTTDEHNTKSESANHLDASRVLVEPLDPRIAELPDARIRKTSMIQLTVSLN